MKFLKFLSKNIIPSPEDYYQVDFTFVIDNSLGKINKYQNSDIKFIEVRLTHREVASLLSPPLSYKLEQAIFRIAQNYIIWTSLGGKKNKEREKLYSKAKEYLNLDSSPLVDFHTEVIKVEMK